MTSNEVPTRPPATRPVVVGIDGSAGSTAALDVAFEEARRRGVALRIVAAWNIPAMATGFAAPALAVGYMYSDLYAAEAGMASSRLTAALEHLSTEPAIPIETQAVEGYPSAVLVEASKDACLLVVGRRGHSRLSEAFIGSTSRTCVEHAACPVLVVPVPPCNSHDEPDDARRAPEPVEASIGG